MNRIILVVFSVLVCILARATSQTTTEVDSISLLKSELEYANAELAIARSDYQNLAEEKKLNEIWGKGRYTLIAYAPSASVAEDGVKSKSAFSFAIAKGNQYFFNKKPIGGILKLGIDVRWTEMSITKYKKREYIITDGWIDDSINSDYDGNNGLDYFDAFSNLGRYDLTISALGVGPVISIAPLSHLENAARYLRATIYFHYKPTLGMHLVSEEGEMESSLAYCNMLDFGGRIQYRRIALGLEGSWGSGKYSQITSFMDDDEILPKVKRRFSQFRIYLAFSI